MTSAAAQRKPGKPRRDRSDSLQKMLELEHIQKLERLQGHRSMPTPAHLSHMAFQQVLNQQLNGRSPQSPPKLSPFPTLHPPPPVKPLVPLQSRRRDTLPAKAPEPLPSAMKAVRRTTAVPSLSISVPPPANNIPEIDRGSEGRESNEHKQKTVTFLGVDNEDKPAEDDASSICHSPSWEAFGQKKKKEKKNEDKMRRKEKEQADRLAEKEAKSIAKRLGAKLHKTPPSQRPPSASRTMSSPIMLADEQIRPASTQAFYSAPPPPRPQHARQRSDSVAMQLKAALTGQKPQSQANDEPSFIGGLKLDQERQAASGMPLRKPNPPVSLMNQRAQSFGPEVRVQVAGGFHPPTLPRSASDGPMSEGLDYDRSLRPKPQQNSMKVPSWNQPLVSPTAPPVPDVSKLQQWKNRSTQHKVPVPTDSEATEVTLVEPSVDFEQERGRRRESYVHQHRQQSRDRSITGYRDEVRVSSARSHYPPQSNRPHHQGRSYSSSSETSPMGSNFPPRNGSLTNLDASNGPHVQGEDFLITFRLPYTPPANGSPSQGSFERSLSEQPPMSRLASTEIPLPPERSASREKLPPTPGAAIRSFKDAAKAAFHRVSPSASKPPVSNYFARAVRDTTLTPDSTSSSRYSSPSLDHLPLSAPPVRPPFVESAESSMPSRDSSARPTDRSSMSSFEEPMSSPSPATTPDSSRPQSEKGLPPVDGEVRRVDNEAVVVDNDERSYRLSHKAAMATTSPIASNPRISLPPQIPVQNHEAHLSELEALVSEKFGRKASVADCESDSDVCLTPGFTDGSKYASAAGSPTTSVSLSNSQELDRRSPHKEFEDAPQTAEEQVRSSIQRRPSLSKSRSSPDLALDTSFLPKLKHQPLVPRPLVPPPPPRSAKRASSPANKTVAQSSPLSADARKSIVSLKAPSNPSNYLEQARKSMPVPPRSSRASRSSIVPPDGNVEPVAKMLVECCSCKFLHDLPSKVYECMAKPDGMVEDRNLGVSGIISTTCHAYDTNSPAQLTSDVYTPRIRLDYAAFFGADAPTAADAADWARSAVGALDGMTATQHLLAGIVAELPQPSTSSSSERPETCRATANVMASLVREGARGGSLMQNGGYYEFELMRVRELEEQGKNPWRISFHKAVPT
ncbi:hypothetical protein CBS470a_012077 [Colletotrichum nupharicola]|nr:hypothetical protein CBS470a_012077 [Colletotrichum nupharicola]